MQQAVHDKFDTLNNITNIIHTIDNWDGTDDETGEKISMNLKKKITSSSAKVSALENNPIIVCLDR